MNEPQNGLAEHPFLKDVKPEHLALLGPNSMPVRFDPGTVVFKTGDPANRFYLIKPKYPLKAAID